MDIWEIVFIGAFVVAIIVATVLWWCGAKVCCQMQEGRNQHLDIARLQQQSAGVFAITNRTYESSLDLPPIFNFNENPLNVLPPSYEEAMKMQTVSSGPHSSQNRETSIK